MPDLWLKVPGAEPECAQNRSVDDGLDRELISAVDVGFGTHAAAAGARSLEDGSLAPGQSAEAPIGES